MKWEFVSPTEIIRGNTVHWLIPDKIYWKSIGLTLLLEIIFRKFEFHFVISVGQRIFRFPLLQIVPELLFSCLVYCFSLPIVYVFTVYTFLSSVRVMQLINKHALTDTNLKIQRNSCRIIIMIKTVIYIWIYLWVHTHFNVPAYVEFYGNWLTFSGYYERIDPDFSQIKECTL